MCISHDGMDADVIEDDQRATKFFSIFSRISREARFMKIRGSGRRLEGKHCLIQTIFLSGNSGNKHRRIFHGTLFPLAD